MIEIRLYVYADGISQESIHISYITLEESLLGSDRVDAAIS